MASQFRGHRPATAEAPARPARRESYPDISQQSSAKATPPWLDKRKSLIAPPDEWTDSGDDFRYTLAPEGGDQ